MATMPKKLVIADRYKSTFNNPTKAEYIINTFYHNMPRRKNEDYMFVKKRVLTHDNQWVTTYELYKNIKRVKWVTDPKYRTHTYKKQVEDISKLIVSYSYQTRLLEDLVRELELPFNFSRNPKDVFSNPYIYGADIDPESLLKIQTYLERCKVIEQDESITHLPPLNIATMDIEQHTVTEEIILVTLCYKPTFNDPKIYVHTFIAKPYMQIKDPNTKQSKPLTLEAIKKLSAELYPEYHKDPNIEFVYTIAEDEKDLLLQLKKTLDSIDIDFLGIWNLDFEVPTIITALKRYGINPGWYFSYPKLADDFKYAKYEKDTLVRDHYILKWHYLHTPSHFAWIDLMTLYAWNRRTKGYEPSYALNDILEKNIGKGKTFQITDHTYYQTYCMDKYVVYNQFDALGPYLMEEKNQDITMMYLRSLLMPYYHYSKTTVLLRNSFFTFYLPKNKVLCAWGRTPEEFDKLFMRVGGAVLPLYRTYGSEANIFIEDPNIKTGCYFYVNDIDFSSIYPSVMVSHNISNQSYLLSVIELEHKPKPFIFKLFNYLVNYKANIAYLANSIYGLPKFDKVLTLFEEYLKTGGIKDGS